MKIIVSNIKSLRDAYEVIVKGADGISFDTENEISKNEEIAFYLPPLASSVLITNAVTPIKVVEEAKRINVNIIQFEGDILINDIAIIREKTPYIKVMKKITINDKETIKIAEKYKKHVDALILEIDKIDASKLQICQKIIDDCDYVILKTNNLEEEISILNELKPYGIIVPYKECKQLKEYKKELEK